MLPHPGPDQGVTSQQVTPPSLENGSILHSRYPPQAVDPNSREFQSGHLAVSPTFCVTPFKSLGLSGSTFSCWKKDLNVKGFHVPGGGPILQAQGPVGGRSGTASARPPSLPLRTQSSLDRGSPSSLCKTEAWDEPRASICTPLHSRERRR